MIIVTGSGGFIGGAVHRRLVAAGYDVLGVDTEGDVSIFDFIRSWLQDNERQVDWVIHLGANTDTLGKDKTVYDEHNTGYSKSLWYQCARFGIPFIYASSAATYGKGELGYSDHLSPNGLKPLNLYGHSKNEFDKFVLQHSNTPPYWYGLKFFNAYGYNESKKGRMASMVYHGYTQIKETGLLKLFKHGHHLRDFVYVEDICDVILWMIKRKPKSDIYNVGTGEAREFNDLGYALFEALHLPTNINYFQMPEELIEQYQHFTEADIRKLRNEGYLNKFTTLEQGVKQYVEILENESKTIPSITQ